MNIDDKILEINSLRFAIKMEINSIYGVNCDLKRLKELYDNQHKLLTQKNKLQLHKTRIQKLSRINDKSSN